MEDINIIQILLISLVFLAQAVTIALKIIAKKAEKKEEKKEEIPSNPVNSNGVLGKNKMCLDHDRKITLNTNNILHIEKKIDKNAEENRRAHRLMFKKLDNISGIKQ